jgi:hypothetical protein
MQAAMALIADRAIERALGLLQKKNVGFEARCGDPRGVDERDGAVPTTPPELDIDSPQQFERCWFGGRISRSRTWPRKLEPLDVALERERVA